MALDPRPLDVIPALRPSRLPPYSPDFNPIEFALAKLKALPRTAAARTRDALWNTVGIVLDTITPQECRNLFTATGYEPD